MMEINVTEDGKIMEVLIDGDDYIGQQCKKHSKVASSRACKIGLVMKVKTQWHSKNICMSGPKSTIQREKKEIPKIKVIMDNNPQYEFQQTRSW